MGATSFHTMPKLYIDVTPVCETGHEMIRLDRPYGRHSASVWTCTRPECENYCKKLVVPMVAVEALVIGECNEEDIAKGIYSLFHSPPIH